MVLPGVNEIKSLRVRLEITQEQLAKATKVSQSTIAKIENGSTHPSYDVVKKLIEFLQGMEGKTELKARQIMKHGVITVQKKNKVVNAIKLMRRHNVSQLPVTSYGKVVGSVGEKTILDKVSQGIDLSSIGEQYVEEIMQEPFPQIDDNTPLSVVSALLQYAPAVLVLKREHITGIITKADLLKAASK